MAGNTFASLWVSLAPALFTALENDDTSIWCYWNVIISACMITFTSWFYKALTFPSARNCVALCLLCLLWFCLKLTFVSFLMEAIFSQRSPEDWLGESLLFEVEAQKVSNVPLTGLEKHSALQIKPIRGPVRLPTWQSGTPCAISLSCAQAVRMARQGKKDMEIKLPGWEYHSMILNALLVLGAGNESAVSCF